MARHFGGFERFIEMAGKAKPLWLAAALFPHGLSLLPLATLARP